MYRYLTAFVVLCTPVYAAPWEEVIPAISEQAARYIDEADTRYETIWNENNTTPYPGSFEAAGGTDSTDVIVKSDHECGILGRMLGVPELIKEHEFVDVPQITDDMSAQDISRLWSAGRSYELWVEQATHLVAQNLVTKIDTWERQCRHVPYAPEFITGTGGPAYDDFPTQSYLPDDHPVFEIDTEGWDDWSLERYLPTIQAMLEQGPNFAGRYSVALLSCGTSCRFYVITDAETGERIASPVGGESSPELNVDFNNDSQLMYARQMGNTSAECVLQAWSFDGSEFNLEHEYTFPRGEVGCNTGNFRVLIE